MLELAHKKVGSRLKLSENERKEYSERGKIKNDSMKKGTYGEEKKSTRIESVM